MDSILNEYMWEFFVDRQDISNLILKKIYYVDSQSFTDIECIEQWNFVIPESHIICDDPDKIQKIRNGIEKCNAILANGKVKIL